MSSSSSSNAAKGARQPFARKSAPAVAAPPPPPPKTYAVNASAGFRDREVWLVKVPEVVADIVRGGTRADAAAAHANLCIGNISETQLGSGAAAAQRNSASSSSSSSSSSSAGGGISHVSKKRTTLQLQCELDPASIVDALGLGATSEVPSKYRLTLDAPNGTRILSFSEESGYQFTGVVSGFGHMAPEPTDPAYNGYVSARRQREKTALAGKKSTTLAPSLSASGPLNNAATVIAAQASSGAPASAFSSASSTVIPRVSTIYALFEHGAYWSVHEMATATGTKEADLRAEVLKACDYVRTGSHRGRYKLKPEYSTVKTVAPEPNDGQAL